MEDRRRCLPEPFHHHVHHRNGLHRALCAHRAEWWVVQSAANYFAWFIWIYILFGSPWWGSTICSGIGSGLSVCKCCGPVSSIKIGMGLGLPAGIIPICFTVLGFMTTKGEISGAMATGQLVAIALGGQITGELATQLF